jgi:methylsterol monooxygenase
MSVPFLIPPCVSLCVSLSITQTKSSNSKVVSNCVIKVLLSQLLVQLPMIMCFHYFVEGLGFRLHTPLPRPSTLLWKLPLFFIIEDFYFYWAHRFLHWKVIYGSIHKIHHEHAHLFGLAAEYAHPVETVILGIGTIIGPALLARHMLTLWAWLIVRLFETVEDHCGYDIPSVTKLIPFWGGARHHDFHHERNVGNFASVFVIWDYVFGTDVQYRKRYGIGSPFQPYLQLIGLGSSASKVTPAKKSE